MGAFDSDWKHRCSCGTCPGCSIACWGRWWAEGSSVWHNRRPYPGGILAHMQKRLITQKCVENWFKQKNGNEFRVVTVETLLVYTPLQWNSGRGNNKSGADSCINSTQMKDKPALQWSTESAEEVSDSRKLPLEWKEMRQSHRGHLSTGSLRMTSSGKMTTVMYSNLHSLSRIWVIGFDLDFFIMQQIPTIICRSGGWTKRTAVKLQSLSSAGATCNSMSFHVIPCQANIPFTEKQRQLRWPRF